MNAPEVLEAQRVFRVLLRAASRPGEPCELPDGGDSPGENVLLALLDQEVSFRVRSPSEEPEARALERRLTGATGARTAPPAEADFALFAGGDSGGEILRLKRGTLETPEEGGTALYAVRSLTGGSLTLGLSGPGVPGEKKLTVEGLATHEAEAIRESRKSYPAGVDVYLMDEEGRVVGLPRSTRLEVSG